MNTIRLRGESFFDITSTHKALKKALSLPDYYGENLDALWDCLTGWIDLPVTIIWDNYELSEKNLGEYAEKLMAVFADASVAVKELHFITN